MIDRAALVARTYFPRVSHWRSDACATAWPLLGGAAAVPAFHGT